jgi:hypothetical protein
MARTHITAFITPTATALGGDSVHHTLRIHPESEYTGTALVIQPPSGMSLDEQLTVADRFLKGVQQWRDNIARAADQNRTAEDELKAAQARIAELEAAAEGSDL